MMDDIELIKKCTSITSMHTNLCDILPTLNPVKSSLGE